MKLQCTANQREFLDALLFDDSIETVAFGGARGGGKTFISCLAMVLLLLMHPGASGLMLRRTQGAADQNLKTEIDNVLRLLGIPDKTVKYRVQPALYLFPNGSRLKLGYCKLTQDYEQYQGVEWTYIALEEATQHLEENIDKIFGSCRSKTGAKAKKWLTCNPGGVGHSWVKERFIDNPRPGTKFIQSLIISNLAQLERDPGYARRELSHLPDWLRRQWLEGDWNAIAGAYFTINPAQIREIVPPYYADWYGGADWGSASPFCCLWVAKWQDSSGKNFCHVVREIYRAGLELDEQAQAVVEMEEYLRDSGLCHAGRTRFYADPMVSKKLEGERTEAGRTYRSVWARHGFYVQPAHTNARVPGWQLLRMLLSHGILTIDPGCKALLKELRGAVYMGTAGGGEPSGEDIDTDCPDHALDSLRYGIVSTFKLSFKTDEANPYELINEQLLLPDDAPKD